MLINAAKVTFFIYSFTYLFIYLFIYLSIYLDGQLSLETIILRLLMNEKQRWQNKAMQISCLRIWVACNL